MDDPTTFDEELTQFTCFGDDLTVFDQASEKISEADNRALKVGSVFLGKYTILKILGSGNFGMIYLLEANDASKKLLVAKEFFPNGFVYRSKENNDVVLKKNITENELKTYDFMKRIFVGEATNLVKATQKSHPNVVTFFALEENYNNTIYFIMDYERGVSLKEYLSKKESDGDRLSNQEIEKIILSLLDGLDHIHRVGVYHQDIKLENILIKEDRSPVLLDFGASVIIYDEEEDKYFNAATPKYAAIEQIHTDKPPKIDQSTDLYALGVVAYRLITGEFPAKSKERMDNVAKGKKDPYVPLKEQKLSHYNPKLLSATDMALSLLKNDRPQSAKEYAEEITNKKSILKYIFAFVVVLGSIIYAFMPNETGKVQLTVTKKGYTVFVGDKKIIPNKDNMVELSTGKHNIIITKSGFIPFEKNIIVKPGKITNLKVDLTPTHQTVTIDTNTPEATIILNGNALKKNHFTAKHGETYNIKIAAKGYEMIEKTFDYRELFEKNFKLYFKLSVNTVTVNITIDAPIKMGVTTVKVNNIPIRNRQFVAKKGIKYTIETSNPYYMPLKVEREFKELLDSPEQIFSLVQGEGTLEIEVKQSDTKVTIYQIVDGREISLNNKPYRIKNNLVVSIPSSDKIYIVVSKEGYTPIKSRVFSLRNNESVKKVFDLSSAKKIVNISSSLVKSTPYSHKMVEVEGEEYSISKYEVTFDAFSRFLNGSEDAARNTSKDGHRLYGEKIFKYISRTPDGFSVNKSYKNYPVHYVSWYGAKAYVDWLREKTGRAFFLPSEKQWHKAASKGYNGQKIAYRANYNSGVMFAKGLKEQDDAMLYDMFGNVFEWTSTPSGFEKHIIKGGSYRSKKSFLTPAKSSQEYSQNTNRKDLGFRIIEKQR